MNHKYLLMYIYLDHIYNTLVNKNFIVYIDKEAFHMTQSKGIPKVHCRL